MNRDEVTFCYACGKTNLQATSTRLRKCWIQFHLLQYCFSFFEIQFRIWNERFSAQKLSFMSQYTLFIEISTVIYHWCASTGVLSFENKIHNIALLNKSTIMMENYTYSPWLIHRKWSFSFHQKNDDLNRFVRKNDVKSV